MADLLRKFHTEVSVCSVFWYTLIHDLVYDIQHVVLQKSKRDTHTKNVNIVIMKLLSVCLMFTLIIHKCYSDPSAARNRWDTGPGMSGTGWRAVCISEGPSCRPDYPALRPPDSALHLRSKTGRVAEGPTSAPHNRKTEILSWTIEWTTNLLRCLCMYLHEQWPLSIAQWLYYSAQHSWGVKATHSVKKMWPERNTGCCMIVGNYTKTGIKKCTEPQADLWPSSAAFHMPQETFSRQCIMGLGGERSREDSNNLFTSLCLTLIIRPYDMLFLLLWFSVLSY